MVKWDIVNSEGAAVLSFTSFLECEVKNQSRIVNAPVEEGGFASYNKVTDPLEISVTIGISGADSVLQEQLDKIQKLKDGLELLSVITPEAEYKNLNLTGYSYRRQREDGISALWIEMDFKEVQTVATEYTSTRLAVRQNAGIKKTTDTSIVASMLH